MSSHVDVRVGAKQLPLEHNAWWDAKCECLAAGKSCNFNSTSPMPVTQIGRLQQLSFSPKVLQRLTLHSKRECFQLCEAHTACVTVLFADGAASVVDSEEDSCLLFSTFDVLRSADMDAMGGVVVAGKVNACPSLQISAVQLCYATTQGLLGSSSDCLNLGEDYSSEQSYFRYPARHPAAYFQEGAFVMVAADAGAMATQQCWRHNNTQYHDHLQCSDGRFVLPQLAGAVNITADCSNVSSINGLRSHRKYCPPTHPYKCARNATHWQPMWGV